MKEEVAVIVYEEYLPTGEITIGSTSYDQDWNIILPALGYDRKNYTYSVEFINYLLMPDGKESVTTINKLTIFRKEQK